MDWLPDPGDYFGFGRSPAEPTFAGLTELNLDVLGALVERWDAVRADMAEMSVTAEHDMVGGAAHAGWRGENATVTRDFLGVTADRFRFAHERAHTVHGLLQTLHDDLAGVRRELLQLKATALERGVYVDQEGAVHPAEHPEMTLESVRLREFLPQEPFAEELPPGTYEAMVATDEDVRRIVDRATEADRLAARALERMADEDAGEQFARSPYPGAEAAHAALIREDATAFVELARDDELSATDLHRMDRYLEDHADDPRFAAFVVDEIGMAEYLLLADRTDRAATELNSAGPLANDLRAGLGTALSTSLRVPGDMSTAPPGSPAYAQWLQTGEGRDYTRRYEAFVDAGGSRLQGDTWLAADDRRIGFDVALDLLEASDVPVDDQFFFDATRDLIALEREDPDIWSHDRFPARPGDEGYPMVDPWDPQNDVVDRMLGMGAHSNPDAVTAFFDPEGPGADHLEYFLGDENGAGRRLDSGDGLRDIISVPSPGPGLAAALEAAATGLSPGGAPLPGETHQHSEATVRVAEEIWNNLSRDYQGASELSENDPARIAEGQVLESLRPALGNIAADYIADVQYALTTQEIEPRPEPHADLDSENMALMLHALGQEPDAYAAITAANEAYTYVTIDASLNGGSADEEARQGQLTAAMTGSGQVAGLMTDAHARAMYEGHIAADEAHNATVDQVQTWTERTLAATVDVGLEGIRGAGPAAVQMREAITEAVFGTFTQDNQATAEEQAQRTYANSQQYFREEVVLAAVESALERGDHDVSSEEASGYRSTATREADTGFSVGSTKSLHL
ncbi:hypothetical protein [Streptomyces radicis]|uniref:Uncharacterized protein n=1 Tax=Streptomyces radicis TaxID=1750517 RepID=A0A3A9WNL3_9ACTN|nr:hypothetical protein [Streptomyces radicis]RKN09326.1 hypothetical protein D7319_12755 [Streptomyces radicis]RKN23076.1 hypothetical protein D7318_13770 [Streptomyces radicis]